ncbi:hypothetical protein F4808DRAFT_426402 [Astrocystis sublimbata]|nr:hypothetical protein F4808DRAFT_426402 [Astrocystis sublimbata]
MTVCKGTILITGANGGLGHEAVGQIVTSPELAGHYHGLYAVREARNASALRSALSRARATESHSHSVESLDLSRLASVRSFAASVNARVAARELPPIRALILNAGYTDMGNERLTEDGFDLSFASNYLSHWLLTLLLLQSIDRECGRIVVMGSITHEYVHSSPFFAEMIYHLDQAECPSVYHHHTLPFPQIDVHLDSRFYLGGFSTLTCHLYLIYSVNHPMNKATGYYDDEEWQTFFKDDVTIDAIAGGTWAPNATSTPYLGSGRRYGASKMCAVMMIGELQRRLDADPTLSRISIVGIDPGTMFTGLIREGSLFTRLFIFPLIIWPLSHFLALFYRNPVIRTPARSAGDVLRAALEVDPKLKGAYLDGTELSAVAREAADAEKRKNVWEHSVKYTQLTSQDTVLRSWA